ncbi:MAG: sigma factor-like helix-turn-helix DNA-binding protein [Candidatus Bathyarchaeia archaeon]
MMTVMSLLHGYLTPRQRRIWRLRFEGLTQADISRRLRVTRQTVNRAVTTIDAKVSRALTEAAQLHGVEARRLDPLKGYLLGYSGRLKTDVLITFSSTNGVQVWYRGEGECGSCSRLKECTRILLSEAEERGIELAEGDKAGPPSKLAERLFTRILKEG